MDKPKCFGKLYHPKAVECGVCEFVEDCTRLSRERQVKEKKPDGRRSGRDQVKVFILDILEHEQLNMTMIEKRVKEHFGQYHSIVRKAVKELKQSGRLELEIVNRHWLYSASKEESDEG